MILSYKESLYNGLKNKINHWFGLENLVYLEWN